MKNVFVSEAVLFLYELDRKCTLFLCRYPKKSLNIAKSLVFFFFVIIKDRNFHNSGEVLKRGIIMSWFLFCVLCGIVGNLIILAVVYLDTIIGWFPVIEAVDGFLKSVSGEIQRFGDVHNFIYVILTGLTSLIIILLLGFGISFVSNKRKHKSPIVVNIIAGIVLIAGINILKLNKMIGVMLLAAACVIVFIGFISYVGKTGVARGFFGTLMLQAGLYLLPSGLCYLAAFVCVLVMVVIICYVSSMIHAGIDAAIAEGESFAVDFDKVREELDYEAAQNKLAGEAAMSARRDEVYENLRRTTGASAYDVKVNSDGSKFNVGGEWHSVSRDGSSYETSSGSWEKFKR